MKRYSRTIALIAILAILALALWWQFSAGLVLHPDRPILKADPQMRLAFLLVFASATALAVWVAFGLRSWLGRGESSAPAGVDKN